eukprot:15289612-Alexandrium_andersonii.AAC.1
MSASLVGSEMCIRDSACAVCSADRMARSPALHCTCRRSAWKQIGLFSVSYTHLTLPTICSV